MLVNCSFTLRFNTILVESNVGSEKSFLFKQVLVLKWI